MWRSRRCLLGLLAWTARIGRRFAIGRASSSPSALAALTRSPVTARGAWHTRTGRSLSRAHDVAVAADAAPFGVRRSHSESHTCQGARSGFPTLSVGSIVPVGAQVCPYESNEPSSTLLRVIQPAQSRNSEIRPSSKRPKVRPQLCFRAHRMQIACEKWPCYYINRAQWFHPAQLPP